MIVVQVGVDADGFAVYGDKRTGRTVAEEIDHLNALVSESQQQRRPPDGRLRLLDADGFPFEVPAFW